MCSVSNYVEKGNISEEIVEVSSLFINFLLKEVMYYCLYGSIYLHCYLVIHKSNILGKKSSIQYGSFIHRKE